MREEKKRKILIVQPVMAHYRRSLFEQLKRNKDYEVEFLAGSNYQNIKEIDGVESERLSFKSLKIARHTFYYLSGALRYIYRKKPDVIICSGIDPHLIHTLAIFFVFRMVFRNKFFWWSHASVGNQGVFGRKIRKFFYKNATGILTYSLQGKETIESWGINPNKTMAIGNCLNIEDYGFLNNNLQYVTNKKEYIIVFSGRINKERRLDILLNALAVVKNSSVVNFKCYIIGNGSTTDLLTLVHSLKLNNQVVFTGALYGKEIANILLRADLMVYPKAIGLSLLHAYSYGIPVITTDNISIQMPEIELLIPTKTGDFYKDEDTNDLAKQILAWLTKDPNSIIDVSTNCINRIIELSYLPNEMAEKIITSIS